MKKFLLAGVAAAALAGSAYAYTSYAVADDAPAHAEFRMQERAALLDGHIAGLKASLNLNADQEKNWPGFESAIRSIAKDRMDQFRAMREARKNETERPTPIDHMRMIADRLAKNSTDLKTLADAAQPLYASLDDTQKREFGPLFHAFVRDGRHDGGGEHRHGGGEERGGDQ
ncbi:MAG TPA: Spy/CpxP family protein refolding chaperone [Roseiarcus sp.]|nr:Spy/CpxP family protein refolding chaperone [Roseiarcus sp.]